MQYELIYWDSPNGVPGTMRLEAEDDASAMAYADRLVSDGFRNAAGACLALANDESYTCVNRCGRAIGQINHAFWEGK